LISDGSILTAFTSSFAVIRTVTRPPPEVPRLDAAILPASPHLGLQLRRLLSYAEKISHRCFL